MTLRRERLNAPLWGSQSVGRNEALTGAVDTLTTTGGRPSRPGWSAASSARSSG